MTRLGLNLLTSEPPAHDAEVIQAIAMGKGVRAPTWPQQQGAARRVVARPAYLSSHASPSRQLL
jgi:hypothetical protein